MREVPILSATPVGCKRVDHSAEPPRQSRRSHPAVAASPTCALPAVCRGPPNHASTSCSPSPLITGPVSRLHPSLPGSRTPPGHLYDCRDTLPGGLLFLSSVLQLRERAVMRRQALDPRFNPAIGASLVVHFRLVEPVPRRLAWQARQSTHIRSSFDGEAVGLGARSDLIRRILAHPRSVPTPGRYRRSRNSPLFKSAQATSSRVWRRWGDWLR